MADTGIPSLYDEEKSLRALARARLRRDSVTRAQVAIADGLVANLERHFSATETETAGRALLIGVGAGASLAAEDLTAEAILNILGFAAARMVSDGRDWLGAQGGDGEH